MKFGVKWKKVIAQQLIFNTCTGIEEEKKMTQTAFLFTSIIYGSLSVNVLPIVLFISCNPFEVSSCYKDIVWEHIPYELKIL